MAVLLQHLQEPSSFAGAITLGAHSTFDVDGTQLTVSGNVTDGAGTYNID